MSLRSRVLELGQRAVLALAIAIAWAALSRYAALFEVQPGFSFFFAAGAITVLGAAWLGWLGVAAVTAGNFILPWGAATGAWRELAFALPTTLWGIVVVLAVVRTGPTAVRLRRFVTIGVAGGSLAAALLGSALLALLQGPATWASFSRVAFLWWVADMTPALALGLPAVVLAAPATLLDADDLTAWREWLVRGAEVWRAVAFGIGGAALLYLAASLLRAEMHWFVVLLLPAVIVASVGGGLAAGLVVTGAMSVVYLAYVLITLARPAGELVVMLSATYANLCLFVAFAIIAGLLSGRNRQLVEHVRRQGEVLTRGLEETVEALAAAMQARMGSDHGHLDRVARLATLVGREMGMRGDELANLRRAAVLHDVGTIGVPESILNKAADLEAEERVLLERHVDLGVDILQRVEFLHPVVALVRYHRERWDGSRGGLRPGRYGLSGEEIPLGSRIIAAVEAFDAISHERPHRRAQGRNAAVAELWRCAGSQFDPAVVACLTRVVSQERDLARATIAAGTDAH